VVKKSTLGILKVMHSDVKVTDSLFGKGILVDGLLLKAIYFACIFTTVATWFVFRISALCISNDC